MEQVAHHQGHSVPWYIKVKQMKKIIHLHLALSIILTVFAADAAAQTNDIMLRVKSEQKQLFSETGMLKELADDIYFEKVELLKRAIADWFRAEVKRWSSGQTMYQDDIGLAQNTSITAFEKDDKIFVRYTLPVNSISFKVTTAEVFGVGKGKYADATVFILFDVMGDFELIQNGTAESIRLINPVWTIEKRSHRAENLQLNSLEKDDLEFMMSMMNREMRPIFNSLSGINEKMNVYLGSSIIGNQALQKEFSIDENKELKAIADVEKGELVFQHSYSKAGMTKRSSTTDAGIVKEGPKSTSQPSVPVSTSASDVKKKNNVSNGSKVAPALKKN
jgi:hypothetical protein